VCDRIFTLTHPASGHGAFARVFLGKLFVSAPSNTGVHGVVASSAAALPGMCVHCVVCLLVR
jgi:hypothetical protein